MNVKTIVIVVLLAVVAGVAAYRFWSSDERAIRRQLVLIEEAGSKDAAEQPMEGLLKAARLAGVFSDPCQLTVESGHHVGSYPRKQIQDRIVLVRAMYTRVEVSLHDIAIDLSGKNTAAVRGTIRLRGQGKGEPVADVQELRAEMAKSNGQWLFTSVTIVEVLER